MNIIVEGKSFTRNGVMVPRVDDEIYLKTDNGEFRLKVIKITWDDSYIDLDPSLYCERI